MFYAFATAWEIIRKVSVNRMLKIVWKKAKTLFYVRIKWWVKFNFEIREENLLKKKQHIFDFGVK